MKENGLERTSSKNLVDYFPHEPQESHNQNFCFTKDNILDIWHLICTLIFMSKTPQIDAIFFKNSYDALGAKYVE